MTYTLPGITFSSLYSSEIHIFNGEQLCSVRQSRNYCNAIKSLKFREPFFTHQQNQKRLCMPADVT